MTRSTTRRAVLCLAATLALGAGVARAEAIVKIADRYPANHYISEAGAKFFMDRVKALAPGAVTFQYYPAEQLGKSKDMFTLTLSGVTDIGEIATTYVSEKLPLSTVAELPGGFATACQGSRAIYRLLQPGGYLYDQEFAPAGLRILFTLTPSPYQAFSRTPFTSLEGLKGLKLRSSGGGMDTFARQLGAVPVRLSAAETYEALSRKTIDGTIFPTASVTAYDLGGFTKSATSGASFGSAVIAYTISEKKWKSLPAPVQEAMTKAGVETTANLCARAESEDDVAIGALKKAGVAFVPLSAADKATFDAAIAPVAESWAAGLDAKGKSGHGTLDAFRKAVAEAAKP